MIRLVVEHDYLLFPHGGANFDASPAKFDDYDTPSILLRRYDAGGCDSVPYPMPADRRDELLNRLALALYDERKCNAHFPTDAIIELPDGTVFDFDAHLRTQVRNPMEHLECNDLPMPDSFPDGCKFVATFSGDEWVRFPDGKWFKASDDGEWLLAKPGMPSQGPDSGAPMTAEGFLSCAAASRAFHARRSRPAPGPSGRV